MIALLRLRESLALDSALVGASAVMVAVLFPRAVLAGSSAARRLLTLLMPVVLGAHVAWALPAPLAGLGVNLAMTLLPLLALFTASLAPAALLGAVTRRLLLPRARPADGAPVDLARAPEAPACASTPTPAPACASSPAPRPGRRAVVALATLVAPAAALGVGVSGFATATALPRVRRIRMQMGVLPRGLAGLQILQLSDLHLGCSRGLDDLERFLATVKAPDLLVLTGDVAEDPSLLAPALRMIAALRPRLGAFACLGNHEHGSGAGLARAIFARSEVDLLVNEARSVGLGASARLSILGIDDPGWVVRADIQPLLTAHLDTAIAQERPADLRLLLSHRPEGFDPAHALGVDLVLAGHTHGGQIGFHGRSAGAPIWPERYLWGRYTRGRSRLYTTAGFGDWYPFRPGCPSEAPLIELVGRESPSDA